MLSYLSVRFLLLLVFCITCNTMMGQCSSYPVPFLQRVSNAAYIVQGKVIDKHCYIDDVTGFVNTLNKFKVAAWLKHHLSDEFIYVITLGGVVGNRAMVVNPALQLDMDYEYLLMLEEDNHKLDDKVFRQQHPQALQLLNYADAQGSLTNENNFYHDLYYRTPKTETAIFEEIRNLTGQMARKPSGEAFIPRPVIVPANNGVMAVSGFSPSSVNSGTILSADHLNITGTGFGSAADTVFFSNADDGGATFIKSGVASDIVSWGETGIVVKPAGRGGTGLIRVKGDMYSATNLIVPYSHIDINSSFNGFGTPTRQRYYLVNTNGRGGYTFTYNTGFDGNADAKAAFHRSLFLWRCNSYINWRISTATSAITTAAQDDINIVVFDASLPIGVLGRSTSYIFGSGSASCTQHNTIWWAKEMDIQFAPNPPIAGFLWQYGPADPSNNEYDFESVASHELGHLHGLGHVITVGDMMYYALANGVTSRLISTSTLNGAIAKINYSTAPFCIVPGSPGSMIAFSAGTCLLPTELTAFSGERKNTSTILLNWITAREINNYGFYIQRSADGTAFREIGFIRANGISNQQGSYQYMDTKAGVLPWYYRIRLLDKDGHEKMSKTIYIKGDEDTDAKVWANPPGNRIFIYLNTGTYSICSFLLINSIGQRIWLKQLKPGTNEIEAGELPEGLYYYQLNYGGKKITGKLLLGNRK